MRSDAAEVRRKLAAKITELAELLHKDLPLAILAALALHEATRDERQHFGSGLQWGW